MARILRGERRCRVFVLAYGVVAGGDFLDWTRVEHGGTLDLVDGVRSIVAAAVA